jgi:hypothetical protein
MSSEHNSTQIMQKRKIPKLLTDHITLAAERSVTHPSLAHIFFFSNSTLNVWDEQKMKTNISHYQKHQAKREREFTMPEN